MPSGVPNEQVDKRQKGFCKFCYQPVVRILYTGTAGRGEVQPFKHAYNRGKVNREQCHRTTLREDQVVDTSPWD